MVPPLILIGLLSQASQAYACVDRASRETPRFHICSAHVQCVLVRVCVTKVVAVLRVPPQQLQSRNGRSPRVTLHGETHR